MSHAPADIDALAHWLSSTPRIHGRDQGAPSGDKRALMETATTNAAEALMRHRMRRSNDLTSRSEAIAELQTYLDLAEAPLRIECIDVSTLQGTDTVASLVVFEDGLPRKRDYRTFIIRTEGADDLASVREVVDGASRESSNQNRRPTMRMCRATARPGEKGGPQTFAYPPGLLVIDGGAPQVAAAQQALTETGVGDIPVVGLAKRLEECGRQSLQIPSSSLGPAKRCISCNGFGTRRTERRLLCTASAGRHGNGAARSMTFPVSDPRRRRPCWPISVPFARFARPRPTNFRRFQELALRSPAPCMRR